MPSQADEEAHQLSYLQKHLANILSLLAEPVEGEGEESLVCDVTTAYLIFLLYIDSSMVFSCNYGPEQLKSVV